MVEVLDFRRPLEPTDSGFEPESRVFESPPARRSLRLIHVFSQPTCWAGAARSCLSATAENLSRASTFFPARARGFVYVEGPWIWLDGAPKLVGVFAPASQPLMSQPHAVGWLWGGFGLIGPIWPTLPKT